jgi:hypothetical protein
MKSIKIACVKSSIYQDLWISDITNDYFKILKTTLMRTPQLGLAEIFNADFIIVKESYEYPCQFNKNVLNESFNNNLKFSKKNKNLVLPFLDESFHENLSIDEVAHNVDDINWNQYNIVITINTCIPERIIEKYSNILWCYYVGENNDELMDKLISKYDILLNQDVTKKNLPDFSIGFPYTFLHPYTLEKINKELLNNNVTKNGIYIEINNTIERPVKNIPYEFINISQICNIPIIVHNQNIIENIKNIYSAKYFIKLFGRKIRGNSILEAISSGTLIFTKKNLITFNDLINEECFIENENDIINKILYLEKNENEYNILVHNQREKMYQLYLVNPINNLFNKYYNKISNIQEKSIFLQNRGVYNIYHFLIYMISNLRNINFIPDNIYLDLSNEYFLKNHNFAIEILSLLYPKSKIISSKEYPNDCLYVPQDPEPINREAGVNSEAYIYLKKIFLPHIINYKLNKTYSKYIYISREDTNYRRIINEDVLFSYLEKKGFEKIILSKLTLLEQMTIFYNASIVISIHGAQLTNILFCNENVKIIEIASKIMCNLLHYEHIAKTFNLNYSRYTSVIETITNSYDSDLIVLNIESFEKYLINNIKISLCIPTKNRFDNFLNIYLDEYIKYLENKLIDEIIISDEDGNDYNKIINKYQDILNKYNNFKVYKNNEILGVFLNKLKVCSYASNNYIALIDSDNFCEESYFIKVKEYILSCDNLSKNLVLSPSYSKPHFSYKSLENIILKKDNINQYTEYNNFGILINTGNYIITKNIIDNIKYDNNILYNISACDVQYFNLLAFKQFEDFEFHIIKDLEYNHNVHNDSEYLKTKKICNLYANKYIYNEIYNLNKYIIFRKSGRFGNALFRYIACVLFCIKYNYEYILEEECPKIKDYLFYKGVDHCNDDIDFNNTNIDNIKNICNNNDNALCFNTLGFIKSDFNINNLNSNDYINEENNHGLYVKNIININDDNYFKHYENCKINNLIMDGYFQFDKIYLEHKKDIINFIERNKNDHKIKTDRDETFLIKDLIDNIQLDNLKIYDIVIHLRLDDFESLNDFIEYKSIISLLKKLDLNNKKIAIVVQKICNDKDNEYINNLLNWFKQNNIQVNIESNDLITDFNIMKQCKILICSNSTLSWSAAYLSKNIELCYMPIDKSKSNDEKYLNRFKKPIENTIFYDVSKKKNCYICGCVLNCEKYLKNVFNNIKKIGKIFDNYKIIIAYDESNDNTLNILNQYKKDLNNICEIEIIINNNISKYKSENISNARNSILNFIRSENNDDYEYFIMMDFDNVCEKDIDVNILNEYLNNNKWDSLSFNRKDYYDIWALSIKPFVTSCWHWNEKQNNSSFVVDIMKDYINNKLNNLDKNELLECYSAFNGFTIYKKDKFINCDYSNNIFKSHALIDNDLIRENLNELNKITGKNNSLFMNLLEDCEHRYFHLSAIQKNNAKIMISPFYLFNENINNETTEHTQDIKNKEENECIIVSSRGILKSCDVKSITPISSINQLLNYDFSKLYDGCSLYVCNYAIPYFSTVINQINCKFILVSGDSDCSIPDEVFKNMNDFHTFINNEKLIHWYSQNSILNHPKLSRIPIGLDYHTMNEKDSDWGEKITPNKQEDILNDIKNNSKPFWEREIKCYANFHFFTNTKYGSDRIDAMNYISKELVFYENNKINRKQTWENQSKYAFVISPHGNGLDCHRTWEALCLGCIPIVKKSGISYLFDELPVLIVEDWKHLNIELLNNTINKFKNSIFNYEKLTLKYWVNKIKTNKIKWNIISPEIKYDLFYNNIIELISKSDDITNILEIGASSGDGSTEAFIIGKKNKNIKLFSIEVCTERFDLLKNRYIDDNNFYPYNISSVSLIDFPSKEDIIEFHNTINSILSNTNINTILSWYDNDISYIKINNIEENGIDKIKEEYNIKYFDCVLIDGSEFTGKAEYDKIYGAKYILLDDINAYKNYYTHILLKNDNNYICLCENYQVRNGFSIFKKNI